MSASGKIVRVNHLSTEAIAPLFVDLDMRNSFQTRGSFTVTNIQELNLVRSITRGGAFQVYREERHIRQSAASDFFACLALRGQVTVAQEGRTCQLDRGDIALMDSRLEYMLAMPDEMDALWIRIPRRRVEGRLDSTKRIVAHRLNGSRGVGLIASRFILTSASQAQHLDPVLASPLASMMVDLLTSAIIAEVSASPPRKSSPMRTLERAKEFIEHHLDDEDLSLVRIAAAVGISPRYLTGLFSAEGCSPMAWVREKRLGASRHALEAQHWSSGAITDIAYRYGFGSISNFNRQFKAHYGVSPRQVMLRPN